MFILSVEVSNCYPSPFNLRSMLREQRKNSDLKKNQFRVLKGCMRFDDPRAKTSSLQ